MWAGWKHDNMKVPVVIAGGLGGTLTTSRSLDSLYDGDDNRKLCSLYLAIMDPRRPAAHPRGDVAVLYTNAVSRWRARLHEIIFEHHTWEGRAFDVALLWCILLSVLAVLLESVESIRLAHGNILRFVEWAFTLLFTVEYVLRLFAVHQPSRYAISFFGIVDLAAVLPTYISVLLPGVQSLLVIRALRLLRVFRILKLGEHVSEARLLMTALRGSRKKITVFLSTVLTIVLIIGALMYLIEGPENGFRNIPLSIYWAIVTMTTVGYGDIAPKTVPGQFVASLLMIVGYAIIAVPTGIVTVELAQIARHDPNPRSCLACAFAGHDVDAVHCKYCGTKLESPAARQQPPVRW